MSVQIATRAATPSPVARLLVALVRLYRATTAFRGPRCRFTPSCSSYAVEALTVHGAVRGLWLSIRRVGRCHPWHPGGHDPVPSVSHPATPEERAS